MPAPDLTLLRKLLNDALRENQILKTELALERALLRDALHELAARGCTPEDLLHKVCAVADPTEGLVS